jgi:hypothetical protein
MLEADAHQRVGKFDVDAEVVGVELERIPRPQAPLFLDVENQPRDLALVLGGELQLVVLVAVRMRFEPNGRRRCVFDGGHGVTHRTTAGHGQTQVV